MPAVKISVVIDNYNYGRFLRECIESCLNQTHAAHEIIVVDDGSTDESREILKSYAEDGRIRVILQENQGQESALQRGFDEVTGDWILGLDSDDFYFPNCLEEIARRASDDLSWLYFKAAYIDGDRQIIGITPPGRDPLLEGDLKKSWLTAKRPPTFPSQSFNCYSLKILRSFPIYPNPLVAMNRYLPADNYLPVLAALHGKVAHIPRILGCYRRHGQGDATVRRRDLSGIRGIFQGDIFRENWLRQLLAETQGTRIAGPIYYTIQVQHWEMRYRSFLQERSTHPVSGDNFLNLFLRLLFVLWRYSPLSPFRKFSRSGKLLLMALLPQKAEKIHQIKLWTPAVHKLRPEFSGQLKSFLCPESKGLPFLKISVPVYSRPIKSPLSGA